MQIIQSRKLSDIQEKYLMESMKCPMASNLSK